MQVTYRKHAIKRLHQRVGVQKNVLTRIIKRNDFVPIGYDLNKKNVKHLLVYLMKNKTHYVICFDEKTNEIITILFGLEFKNWNIDINSFKRSKCIAYERALSNNIIKTISKEDFEFNYNDSLLLEFPLLKEKFPKMTKSKKKKKKKKSKEQLEKDKINNQIEKMRIEKGSRLSEIRKENIELLRSHKITEKDKLDVENYKKRKQKLKERKIKNSEANRF